MFQAVFREAFLKTADASALIFFRRGLADVMERLAAYFAGRGGVIERRATAELVEIEDGRVSAVRYHGLAGGSARQSQRIAAEAAVIATPWHTVAPLLPHALQTSEPFAKLKELRATPIVSVELWLDRPIVQERMVGLREASIDWIFDKGRLLGRLGTPQHLSFVLSAATRDLTRTNADLIDLAKMTLLRFYPGMSEAQVVRALVLREPQATFTCEPAAADLRPGPVTPIRGLVLAGDWTDTGLPATIEGAVRSGAAAAVAIPRSYA
ncbi:MAG: FAD-dependent oxidoreductase [Vicinamibacteria bacterium]|nr:FAD-dependent oxidoreductase [Vicinamibacteria bacterium]